MGFKIWCQVGGGGEKFQNNHIYVTFFFGLKVRFWNTYISVILEIMLAITNL